jgi:hyperosmotically inducible protein
MQASDAELRKSIVAKFDSDPELKAAGLSVDADSKDNNATLSGTVQSEALRMKAVNMARSVRPGLAINDKIDVVERTASSGQKYDETQAKDVREQAKERGDSVGNTIEDAWIHTKIAAKLISDKDTPERKINIDVVDNVVTLRGTVDTAQQKTEAESIAKSTDGVRGVKNLLKVKAS